MKKITRIASLFSFASIISLISTTVVQAHPLAALHVHSVTETLTAIVLLVTCMGMVGFYIRRKVSKSA